MLCFFLFIFTFWIFELGLYQFLFILLVKLFVCNRMHLDFLGWVILYRHSSGFFLNIKSFCTFLTILMKTYSSTWSVTVNSHLLFCFRFFQHLWISCPRFHTSALLGRPNKVGLKCPSARPYGRPSVHKKFLRFQWNLVCWLRSTSDAWRYAV